MIRENTWTAGEEDQLLRLYSVYADTRGKWDIIASAMGKSHEAVRSHWRTHGKFQTNRLKPSPYPKYDSPLTMEGDAVVIPDLELPFHNSDFTNRVLDLAQLWNIDQCISAGDLLHFNSLSSWEANWQEANGKGGLDEKQEELFLRFANGLSQKKQEEAYKLLEEIGTKDEDGDPNVSEELRVARKAVKSIAECFRRVDLVLGNHEGRLLRTLKSPLFPTEITRLIDCQDWRIAPYYYSELTSNGERFRIEHPKNYGKFSAGKLCSKYLCHVLMAHSHQLNYTFDPSGKFYAIEMGTCADEGRMPYVAQRDNTNAQHALGAVIVRDGVPWLLHARTDWKRMARL